MTNIQEPLCYEYDALEPYIDAKTMEIHYTKHHAGYVAKLNVALDKYPNLKDKDVDELLKDLNKIPEDIRTAVRNQGGGHSNHRFFWLLLKKNVKFSGEISEAINAKFGNFEEFKKKFSDLALGIFGSGWVWLVINNGKLEIMTTPNQDTPLSQGKIPVLGLDMWEHSFYLKRMWNKAEYMEAFFNIINWEQVNKNYKKASQ